MGKKHSLDLIHSAMFEGKGDELSATQQNMVKRYESAYTVWLEKPYMSDTQIREHLIDMFGISKAQAYRDIHNIKLLLGNVSNAARTWQQYKVNALLDRAVEAAEAGDHALAKSLTNIGKELTRANRLNLLEGEQIPWDEIVPQSFEPVSDPSVIGVKPIANAHEKIARLKKKYEAELVDTPFIEIPDSDNGS